jgi:thiazole synthase
MDQLVIAGEVFFATHHWHREIPVDGADGKLTAAVPMVTVALRRINLADRSQRKLRFHRYNDTHSCQTSAACYTPTKPFAARLGREIGFGLVKIEVIGDKTTLFPDNEATLEATRVLVKEGFTVLPYFNDDLIMAAS